MIDPTQLTQREEEVLKLIILGCMNREMADLLSLSIRTIESHRANIKDKVAICKNMDKKDVTRQVIIDWSQNREFIPLKLLQPPDLLVLPGYENIDMDSITIMVGV